jgi:hypothetical protein
MGLLAERSIRVALIVGVLLWNTDVTTVVAQGPTPYLKGSQGPYRGRVVDALTGRPIKGALVIAVWKSEDVQIEGLRNDVAQREVLTDSAGEFVIDAAAIESSPPFLTLQPRFLILAHGHMPFPEDVGAVGAPAAQFRGGGAVVKLRPTKTDEERVMSFNLLIASLNRVGAGDPGAAAPGRKPEVSLLERFVREELQGLGFREQGGRGEPEKKVAGEQPAPRPSPPPAASQQWGQYVTRYHGPYRGRVIDAESKQPLAGAVVVAKWRREKIELLRMATVTHALREVLTDAKGEFVMAAEDIERNAPPRTLRPSFVILLPGYGSYPLTQLAPKGFQRGIFEGPGVTVELPPLKTREERLKHLSRLRDPFDFSETPFKDVPNFSRLYSAERVGVGFSPYPLPEKTP